MIKLIVSDLDGTLLNHDKDISKKNIEAIHNAYKKGAKLCLATGRDLSGVTNVIDILGIKPLLILGNGALFYDEQLNIIDEEYFPNEHLKEVLNIFDKHQINYMIFTSDGYYCTNKPEIVCEDFILRSTKIFKKTREEFLSNSHSNMPCCNLVKITDLDSFIKEKKIIKVEAFSQDKNKIPPAIKELEKIEGISYLSSFPDNVEVTATNAQKGLILEKAIKHLNISKEEVMVIGDGLNDISMFERFKYSFAPSNSDDQIKKLAYRVVSSCFDDGVSEAIDIMFKKC